MSIFKIRPTHVKPLISKLYIFECQKKSLPKNCLKSIFFYWFKFAQFFQFFAFKTKKFNFSPDNQARNCKTKCTCVFLWRSCKTFCHRDRSTIEAHEAQRWGAAIGGAPKQCVTTKEGREKCRRKRTTEKIEKKH